MHILVAAHDFYPDPGSGGTGRYVRETSGRLVERGHSVSVVTRRRGNTPWQEEIDGIDVYRYDFEVADRSAVHVLPRLPSASRAIAKHLAEIYGRGTPDILSVHGHVTALLVDRLLEADVPSCITFHSPWPEEYSIRAKRSGRSPLRRRINATIRWALENRLVRKGNRHITLSEFMADRYRQSHGSVDAPSVIPGGTDPDRFSPANDLYRPMGAGNPKFLTVRRLAPRMGHDLLLRSFAQITSDLPGAHLYIAGDGSLRPRLESYASSLGLGEQTTFLGYVPDRDLPSAYAAADYFVLPTRRLEGFGLATLEAMASETPVIATPVGGTTEILDGGITEDLDLDRSMLVAEPSAPAMAEALRFWGDLPGGQRRSLGRQCRRHVLENYSWETVVDALELEFESLVS